MPSELPPHTPQPSPEPQPPAEPEVLPAGAKAKATEQSPVPERPESPEGSPAGPDQERQEEAGEVHFMYKIEGSPTEVPVFELARTLEAVGTIIQESDRVLNPDKHKVVVRVKPFQEGSFLMDLVLSVQNDPLVLFFITHPEAIERIKKVLEYLGLIKKGAEVISTVKDVIEFLKNGRPKQVEPSGPNTFAYTNQQDQIMQVNSPVHTLINNGVIQQNFYAATAAPLEREPVQSVKTYLKGDEPNTAVQIPKTERAAIKAYSEPEPEPEVEKVLENITTEFLNPKAGNYGDTEGTWTFTKAGTSRNPFKAKITHEDFLNKYGRGSIRFYHDDVLTAKLKSEQRLKGTRSSTTYEIIEVLDYKKAPVQKRRRNGRD